MITDQGLHQVIDGRHYWREPINRSGIAIVVIGVVVVVALLAGWV